MLGSLKVVTSQMTYLEHSVSFPFEEATVTEKEGMRFTHGGWVQSWEGMWLQCRKITSTKFTLGKKEKQKRNTEKWWQYVFHLGYERVWGQRTDLPACPSFLYSFVVEALTFLFLWNANAWLKLWLLSIHIKEANSIINVLPATGPEEDPGSPPPNHWSSFQRSLLILTTDHLGYLFSLFAF